MSQLTHEALYFLPRGPQRHALEVALAERDRYEKALRGVASCATQCGCCAMHVRIARQALGWDDTMRVTLGDAYMAIEIKEADDASVHP